MLTETNENYHKGGTNLPTASSHVPLYIHSPSRYQYLWTQKAFLGSHLLETMEGALNKFQKGFPLSL